MRIFVGIHEPHWVRLYSTKRSVKICRDIGQNPSGGGISCILGFPVTHLLNVASKSDVDVLVVQREVDLHVVRVRVPRQDLVDELRHRTHVEVIRFLFTVLELPKITKLVA